MEWTHIGDGPAMALLHKKAETLPGNIVVHLPGALRHEEVLRFYCHHTVDVFVSVSQSEGLPVSAMEALSFGVPIVVTDVGGCRELLESNRNGVLLPASFTDIALANAIQTVTAGGQTMRDAAFSVWQQRFDAQRNYQHFTDLLCSET